MLDGFEPTRLVLRAEEMSDGRAVHVGEGLEVSEEDLHTLPAELQAEFATQIRRVTR
jgi:translation initiation factor 1 (eIF-1/SUI1)